MTLKTYPAHFSALTSMAYHHPGDRLNGDAQDASWPDRDRSLGPHWAPALRPAPGPRPPDSPQQRLTVICIPACPPPLLMNTPGSGARGLWSQVQPARSRQTQEGTGQSWATVLRPPVTRGHLPRGAQLGPSLPQPPPHCSDSSLH